MHPLRVEYPRTARLSRRLRHFVADGLELPRVRQCGAAPSRVSATGKPLQERALHRTRHRAAMSGARLAVRSCRDSRALTDPATRVLEYRQVFVSQGVLAVLVPRNGGAPTI